MSFKNFFRTVIHPTLRMRVEMSIKNGTLTSFLVQLEYDQNETFRSDQSDWIPVVRFDHNRGTDYFRHDVTEEGLHMDVYRFTGQEAIYVHQKTGFPRLALNKYPRYCILYIEDNLKPIMRRFFNGN